MELYISVPIGWDEKTESSHPEETRRVNLAHWFEHDSGAEVFLWESRKRTTLRKANYCYILEVRNPHGTVLYKSEYDKSENNNINYDLENQMDMYPTQEIWSE